MEQTVHTLTLILEVMVQVVNVQLQLQVVVTAVTVTTAGTGYTFGTVSNAQIVGGATSLSGAELDVIIPPQGGHGKNAIEELGGFYVMLNTSLDGTESANSGDVTVANDFRKITLIRDPNSGGSEISQTL